MARVSGGRRARGSARAKWRAATSSRGLLLPTHVARRLRVTPTAARAAQAGTLIGSLSQGHGAPAAVKNAFYDVITAHFNGEYDSDEAIEELLSAVAAAK